MQENTLDLINAIIDGNPIEDEIKQGVVETTKQGEAQDLSEDLVIPKYEKLNKDKVSKEKSARALREARDSARSELEEARKQLDEYKGKASIYDAAKEIIGKDEVTQEDLKQIFSDYDFTKKEKAALEESLKKSQARIREFDITSSEEYQIKFLQPLQEAGNAIAAEIMPIHNGKPIEVPVSARNVFDEIVASGKLDNLEIKAALHKIKDAYEEGDVDFVMPNIMNIKSYLATIINAEKNKQEIFEGWEKSKQEKALEKSDFDATKSQILVQKSRQERKAITQGYMASLMNSDEYDHIAEEHGHDNVMQAIIVQHNALSDAMDDPKKAPTYDKLLEAFAKANLYDQFISEKIKSGKIASIKQAKVNIESAGSKKTINQDSTSEISQLLRKQGVYA